jgi:hypothetical protein
MKPILAGLFLGSALLLPAATPAAACVLDWADAGVVWPSGTLGPHTFAMTGGGCPAGLTVTITVAPGAGTLGSFTSGGSGDVAPKEDCPTPTCSSNFFGSLHDLGIVFDPTTGGASPIEITATFSVPITTLVFEISDVDFSIGGSGQDHRRDQVVITGNNGALIPALSFKTAAPRTFSIAGNTATANCTVSPEPTCNPATDTTAAPSDTGTVVVDFGAASVSTVRITYNEAGNGANPANRGIGVFASLTATPVELTGFTIE